MDVKGSQVEPCDFLIKLLRECVNPLLVLSLLGVELNLGEGLVSEGH